MASNARAIARSQARRYFRSPRDVSIFLRQMGAEANFRDATSPAGAQGYAQLMPGTARSWGVSNPHDPVQAYNAAAKHMAQYLRTYGGDWSKALTAYNAGPGRVGKPLYGETRAYISRILGGGSARAGSLSLGGGGGASPPSLSLSAAAPTVSGDPKKLALADLLSKSNPNSFLVKVLRQQGAADTAPMVKGVLDSMPVVSARAAAARQPSGGGGGALVTGGGRGRVRVASGANRAGVGLQPIVTSFVASIAGIAGHPLTIGTGTNHSRMTTSGNVSDHWDGHGADIPSSGAALTRLGQQALIAAGMDPRKARRQRGGLFNLYKGGHRIQVIFNTNEGGNHYNHLHVGIR